MADRLSPQQRSRLMAKIRGRDTAPERAVRSVLHRMGYRFRLHASDLPGRPDVVLPRLRKVVMVNGCFWHGHGRCRRATLPKTRPTFWKRKIEGNRARDARVRRKLIGLGWKVLVVWECRTKDADALRGLLGKFAAGER